MIKIHSLMLNYLFFLISEISSYAFLESDSMQIRFQVYTFSIFQCPLYGLLYEVFVVLQDRNYAQCPALYVTAIVKNFKLNIDTHKQSTNLSLSQFWRTT